MQAPLPLFEGDQLDFGAGEVAGRGHDAQVLDCRGKDEVVCSRRGGHQRLIDGPTWCGLPFQPQAAGGVALGIDIDDQCFVPEQCEGRGQVDGGGGLADATLLIGDGYHLTGQCFTGSGAVGGCAKFRRHHKFLVFALI